MTVCKHVAALSLDPWTLDPGPNLANLLIFQTRVTIFDWNILAPMWIDISDYQSVNGDTNLLHEDKRLLLVIHRIRQHNADIITLQEVGCLFLTPYHYLELFLFVLYQY